jgi:hypothetical protein
VNHAATPALHNSASHNLNVSNVLCAAYSTCVFAVCGVLLLTHTHYSDVLVIKYVYCGIPTCTSLTLACACLCATTQAGLSTAQSLRTRLNSVKTAADAAVVSTARGQEHINSQVNAYHTFDTLQSSHSYNSSIADEQLVRNMMLCYYALLTNAKQCL